MSTTVINVRKVGPGAGNSTLLTLMTGEERGRRASLLSKEGREKGRTLRRVPNPKAIHGQSPFVYPIFNIYSLGRAEHRRENTLRTVTLLGTMRRIEASHPWVIP